MCWQFFFSWSIFHSDFSSLDNVLCSAEMLVNLGIPWVILGHSERRLILNESNDVSWFLKTLNFSSFGHDIVLSLAVTLYVLIIFTFIKYL